MTDILCRWLNEDLQLEKGITHDSFAAEISNGYLIGMILHQNGLQDDFSSFSKKRTSEAKLNNFTRLEPSLHLLDIPFDSHMAHKVMVGDKGASTKLMYQVFVALNRKKQGHITAQSLRGNRPLAKVKMEQVQTGLYTQLIKQQTPRQFDLNFQQLVEKFQEKKNERDQIIAKKIDIEEERLSRERKESCKAAIEKQRLKRMKQNEMYSQLKPLDLPRPKPKTAPQLSAGSYRAGTGRNKRIALDTQADIDAFETKLANTDPAISNGLSPLVPHTVDFNDKSGTVDYMVHIKERVQEGMIARRDRERRRRKVLMSQLRALKEQEEHRRDQILADRLNRQSLQEKRVVTQLMQIRKEKDNIRENRILRQKQYEKEREREFVLALEREALEAKRKAVVEDILFKAKQDKRKQLLQERARQNYEKHYQICHSIIHQMVDLSTKIGEYRELTQCAIPVKMIRDWKLLFLFNKSLYEDSDLVTATEEEGEKGEGEREKGGEGESASLQSTSTVEDKNAEADDILDDADLQEYLQVTNEWSSENTECPHSPNMVLSHIVYRLIELVKPPQPPSNPPSLPKFYLKGSFVGLPFTGKTSSLKYINETLGVLVLCPNDLVMKAIEVYKSELTERYTSGPVSLSSVEEEEEEEERGGGREGAKTASVKEDGGGEENEEKEGEDSKKQSSFELSSLGQLGEQAYSSVSNGEPVDDSTIVDIIVHELKELEDGSSWVLDNFPTTLQQALLLAKGLTGQGLMSLKEQSSTAELRTHQFILIPEREVEEEELFNLHAVCGLDIVVHFNASSDNIFKRSVKPSSDNVARADIQQCLLSFDSNWPQIKKWYNRFRTIHNIDSNKSFTEVLMDVYELIDDKLLRARQNEAMKKLGIRTFSQQKMMLISKSMSRMSLVNPTGSGKDDDDLPAVPPPNLKNRGRRPSSAGSSPMPKFRSKSQCSPRKGSDDISMTKKGTRKRGRGKEREDERGGESPLDQTLMVPSAESELFLLLDMTAEPGEEGWQYCSLPVHSSLVSSLAERWPEAEKIYALSFRDAFRCLRQERDGLCHYIFSKRNELIEYLKRPDCKQEFVSQWQRKYNELSLNMRQQDFMKSELHHRVDDLCEKLWDICDVRKTDSEKERQSIIDDNWLQDHVGLISNHYISLMQAELTKFQDAVLLLKDYYLSMTSDVPSPLPECNSRIPLIELTVPEEESQSTTATDGGGGEKNKENKKESPKPVEEDKCVPLLIRQLITVPEVPPVEEKGRKKVEREPTPPPPGTEDISDLLLDTQLIVHSYNTALVLASKLLSKEIRLIEEAAAEANKPPENPTPLPTEQEEKASGKGKKGGAKSPAGGKKGKTTPTKTKGKGAQLEPERAETPAPVNVPPSPAQLAMKQKMENMRREHTSALKHEEKILIDRLKLIKEKAVHFIDHLKVEADKLHVDMEQWINECYQLEIQSVNQLAEVLRCAIEQEAKILYELKLPGVNFRINQDVHTYHVSPPSSPPPVLETAQPNQFTVHQLHSLMAHIRLLINETEGLTIEGLTNLFELLSNKTVGENVFPTTWKGLNHEQVQQLMECIYGRSAVSVDWRRLVLCLSQPYPLPSSQDLLTALSSMRDTLKDGRNDKMITRQEYMSVPTWLDEGADEDRNARLKPFFFELFKDNSSDMLDYINMLMVLCSSPDGQDGFFKALSIIKGEPITSSSDTDIALSELQKVINFGATESVPSHGSIQEIYDRVGGGGGEKGEGGDSISALPLSSLIQDTSLLRLINACNQYHLPDVVSVVVPRPPSMEPRLPTSE